MKKLMIGNEAVARGLYEGGVEIVSSYPGTPSTEITEFIAKYEDVYAEWAPNEKVACEVAFGASLAGRRACCAMKHVGLNVAAVASLRSVGPSTTSALSRSNSVAVRDAPNLRRHSPSDTISSACTERM